MRATVLVDNIGNETVQGEWGLCIHIAYEETKLLLDGGASGLFAENAEKLGICIEDVDLAVLSHAHYDHADGLPEFLRRNGKAKLYLQKSCKANCYKREGPEEYRYIGMPESLMQAEDRLVRADGDMEIMKGVWLLAHRTPGLAEKGEAEKLYRKEADGFQPDDFAHEQSLVLDCPNGLVIFNSCCHGGADNIIKEVRDALPGRPVQALVGGFHLYNKTDEQVRALARGIRETGIRRVCTGHCTGDRPFEVLQEELGDVVEHLRVGLVTDF